LYSTNSLLGENPDGMFSLEDKVVT
jgi:hypothetical protein